MNSTVNPYESPAAVDQLTPEQLAAMRRQQLKTWLAVPALAFMFLGLLQAAVAFSLVVAVVSNPTGVADYPVLVVSFVDCLFMLAVAWAGYCMYQLRFLYFVRGIAFACCIPVLTPFVLLGIPFALWAIVVLFQRRAKIIFLENDLPQRRTQRSI